MVWQHVDGGCLSHSFDSWFVKHQVFILIWMPQCLLRRRRQFQIKFYPPDWKSPPSVLSLAWLLAPAVTGEVSKKLVRSPAGLAAPYLCAAPGTWFLPFLSVVFLVQWFVVWLVFASSYTAMVQTERMGSSVRASVFQGTVPLARVSSLLQGC